MPVSFVFLSAMWVAGSRPCEALTTVSRYSNLSGLY